MPFQDCDQAPKRTCLGKIVGAHGVKGLVKILPFGDDPALIEKLSPVFTSEDGVQTLSIVLKNRNGKFWLAAVQGITERNGAEALRGTELYVDVGSLPEIADDNSFYHVDLIGLRAMGEDGAAIGSVIAVENFGAGDLLDIRMANGKTFLIPYANAVSVNMQEKIIRLKDFKQFMDLS